MKIKQIKYAHGYSGSRDHLLDDSELQSLKGREFATIAQLKKAIRAIATGTGEAADGLPVSLTIPTPKGDLTRLWWF